MQNVLIQWNDVLLEAVRQVKPGPPMVARSIAIMYTSIYDAWAAYDPVAKPTRPGITKRPAAENIMNNRCDELATQAADGNDLLIDEGYEEAKNSS